MYIHDINSPDTYEIEIDKLKEKKNPNQQYQEKELICLQQQQYYSDHSNDKEEDLLEKQFTSLI